jgi:hypothetical protein
MDSRQTNFRALDEQEIDQVVGGECMIASVQIMGRVLNIWACNIPETGYQGSKTYWSAP